SHFNKPLLEISDEHHSAIQRLWAWPAASSGRPEGGAVWTYRTQASAARRRPRGEVLHPQSRSRPSHLPGGGKGTARHRLQRWTEGAGFDSPGRRAGGRGTGNAVRGAL